MAAHMRGQATGPADSRHKRAGHGRARHDGGDHGTAWTLIYLLAAAVVAGLVWMIFGGVA